MFSVPAPPDTAISPVSGMAKRRKSMARWGADTCDAFPARPRGALGRQTDNDHRCCGSKTDGARRTNQLAPPRRCRALWGSAAPVFQLGIDRYSIGAVGLGAEAAIDWSAQGPGLSHQIHAGPDETVCKRSRDIIFPMRGKKMKEWRHASSSLPPGSSVVDRVRDAGAQMVPIHSALRGRYRCRSAMLSKAARSSC